MPINQQKTINLALVSPNPISYSETFILAHKSIPGMNIKFYMGGLIPNELEGTGNLMPANGTLKGYDFLCRKFNFTSLSAEEQALARSFRKQKIHCVLAEYGHTAAHILNVCKLLNLPLLVHFHGFDASVREVLERYHDKYLNVFCYANSVIVVSKAMAQKIMELGCPSEKIVYTPCGPSDIFFKLKSEVQGILFTGIGRFVDKKAPYYMILAFQKVVQKYPDARLVLGGDGPLYNTCCNLVRHLKLERNILLPGIISPEEFRSYLKQSTAFVQHSITAANGDMEGTPVAVLEASAAGLAVISTFHAGIPDVVIHNETGLLVQEHDVAGMAEYMLFLIENPEEATRMGTLGRERMLTEFKLEKHLQKLRECITKAVIRDK